MLLVLELDGVLIWASGEDVVKRPGLEAFLRAVSERFELAVWSQRPQASARQLAEVVFGADHALRFIWGQEQGKKRFDEREWADYWLKDLHKLKAQGYELGEIVALDDDDRTYQRSRSPHVLISTFSGEPQDEALAEILEVLMERSAR